MTDDAGTRELERILATAQAEQRLPSVAACAFRDGEVVWQQALGHADVEAGTPATTEHAYRIGSITKTFTAVNDMQLRDESQNRHYYPLSSIVPGAPDASFRQALSHTAGLQREPPGSVWETLRLPGREELVAGLADAEDVIPAGDRFHYSNLVFALLGEAVARVRGATFEEVLQARVLDPLALTRTSFAGTGPVAAGYYVHPWTDEAIREADLVGASSTNALGLLWSTVGDLARWGDFLCTGHDDVLVRATVEEMGRLHVMVDVESWSVGWGLGLTLVKGIAEAHGGSVSVVSTEEAGTTFSVAIPFAVPGAE
jgi:CubicO group peptidase (beta-lactamase class C family)